MGTSAAEGGSPPEGRRIGVFGGTFDPVHNGHLRIALDAREILGLDEVRLIPLAHAVHRDQPETPAAVRLQMLQAAVEGRTDLICDDREMPRKGPSYTIDTLVYLEEKHPGREFQLVMGADGLKTFHKWKHADLIMKALPEWDPDGQTNDVYYWYYGSYAMYQMGGRHWTTWRKAMEKAVVA